ncbi:MAG: hypothetical protein ABIO02_00780 [Patescibacteria group bacterium]
MKKHEHQPNTNFWFGFALGSITLTALAYMVGTKKGREKLKELIDYADTIEDMPEELFRLLPTIKEMLKNEASSDSSSVSEPKESVPQQLGHSLESLIEKVKNSSEEKKEPKKYFVKSDT